MATEPISDRTALIGGLSPDKPVLIAGPTASGKSALALEIADRQGGVIVNADASQVYGCWQVLTARPSLDEMAGIPHHLYGHIEAEAPYSAGHWLREVTPLLGAARPIIVGGTGLYFMALTQGLADIPATPPEVRAHADTLTLEEMLAGLDAETRARIDPANRARVQRAWEVMTTTGRSLTQWQAQTGHPTLAETEANTLVFDAPKDWLNGRIVQRFDMMLAAGALDEARAVLPEYDPSLPAHRAIGAPELVAHLRGEITLEAARERAIIATRQFAKRQRTWFRSKMEGWQRVRPH
ncbi:tRNA dimethylallyltransferase [Roseobacter cerasinus]|uniref:tRNA dimethylallyltransferase n=1 Tax=Roseobacter cerasinus TaxID=2602289 RepID=A0A640VSQ0_9RHOB|nr:tRNA (adenosine(37)-N6)-dimethylallyltransferase MiaA [Roseobacter cerasinus]GFE50121.1 tRNA dimethylallyltransferase [Roseobacter cerasinus]